MIRMPLPVMVLALLPMMPACSPEPNNESGNAAESRGETRNGDLAGAEPAASPNATTAATAPGGSDTAERMQANADAEDLCGASKVAPWIGKDSTVPVRVAVTEASGAAADRWIYPDSVVTQDFRPDRLNVVMEKGSNRIVSAHCG